MTLMQWALQGICLMLLVIIQFTLVLKLAHHKTDIKLSIWKVYWNLIFYFSISSTLFIFTSFGAANIIITDFLISRISSFILLFLVIGILLKIFRKNEICPDKKSFLFAIYCLLATQIFCLLFNLGDDGSGGFMNFIQLLGFMAGFKLLDGPIYLNPYSIHFGTFIIFQIGLIIFINALLFSFKRKITATLFLILAILASGGFFLR
jgi:hypothetical protein